MFPPTEAGKVHFRNKIWRYLSKLLIFISFDTQILLLFLKGFIHLFLERGEGKEKERERNINVWSSLTGPPLRTWPSSQACALTENRTA